MTPGKPIRFQAFATLRTENNQTLPPAGAEGWSISIGTENLKILSVTSEGTIVGDMEWNQITNNKGGMGQFETVDPAYDPGTGPQGEGAVSAVMIFPLSQPHLPIEGTARIAALTLEAVAVEDGPTSGRVFYVDNKKGQGRPVPNTVSLLGSSHSPSLGSREIRFKRGEITDCNQNGSKDPLDIQTGSSRDCNLNGIPDECDLASGRSGDCNQNGQPDECDINEGQSGDCNQNGQPDECDIGEG
ncbi:MAG: hypothetical protein HY717_17240 [Planctomycetes bacterium]|nr:hypothetical protein [Planctomycetota bacterium]